MEIQWILIIFYKVTTNTGIVNTKALLLGKYRVRLRQRIDGMIQLLG